VTVTISGREYTLSERRAYDVMELVVALEKAQATSDGGLNNVLSMAQIVRDSLKATYLKLGKIRGFRYRKLTEPEGITTLLESLEELEGTKKKIPPLTASASDATSVGD
jgi:hypothetical protein